jgi:hypothetical protein
MSGHDSNWPPADAAAYIRTDGFAALVLAVVKELAEKYPQMDFADAVASLFTWLDRKTTSEPEFISLERFPTPLAFRAYLRAGAWNVARLTARQRLREAHVSELSPNFEPVSREAGPEIIIVIQECKDRLPPLHRRVFELFVLDDIPECWHCDRLPYVTSIMQTNAHHLTEDDVQALYEESALAISLCVSGKKTTSRSRKRTRKH